GLGREGARALLRYGFLELGLHRVFAETMAVNTASRATMAAIGMRHVRTFHMVWEDPLPGVEHGEVEYAVTRAEWLTLQGMDGPEASGPAASSTPGRPSDA
ncbi:MAG TPA: GNAT family protein, partial [Kineosporiaceae bacterium]